MPLYSVNKEAEIGIPNLAKVFIEKISSADLLIVSLAEHNGSYFTAFKNLMDWLSRANGEFFQQKPMLLLATSPGAMGGQFVLQAATSRFPRHAARILETFSLPFFQENFDFEKGIVNEEKKAELIEKVKQVSENLQS